MTIFNTLKNNGKYATLKITLENGTELVIENVQFYTPYEINGVARVRIHTRDKADPIEIENVNFLTNLN